MRAGLSARIIFSVSWRRTCGSKSETACRSARVGGTAYACLERSMGKRIKLREAQRRRADRKVSGVLEAHSRRDARPRAVARFDDFNPDFRKKVEDLRSHALRVPADWVCRIKSRAEERRFIDLVRFAFARYRVPPHLEQVWIDKVDDDFVDKISVPDRFARAARP